MYKTIFHHIHFSDIQKHHFLIILSVKCCYILYASAVFEELINFFLPEFQFWVPTAVLSAARLLRLPFLRPLNNMFSLIAFHRSLVGFCNTFSAYSCWLERLV